MCEEIGPFSLFSIQLRMINLIANISAELTPFTISLNVTIRLFILLHAVEWEWNFSHRFHFKFNFIHERNLFFILTYETRFKPSFTCQFTFKCFVLLYVICKHTVRKNISQSNTFRCAVSIELLLWLGYETILLSILCLSSFFVLSIIHITLGAEHLISQ